MHLQNIPDEFPLYLFKIGVELKFLTMSEAGPAFDNGFVAVEIVGYVLCEDFSVRMITAEEKREISDRADRYSESK